MHPVAQPGEFLYIRQAIQSLYGDSCSAWWYFRPAKPILALFLQTGSITLNNAVGPARIRARRPTDGGAAPFGAARKRSPFG